jgi:hypothetical protein
MRESIDAVALVVGYWTLLCVLGLLALFIGTLVHDALWPPTPPVVVVPIDVWTMGPFLNPHPWPTETVLHVETDDVEQAWRVIGGSAA